MTVLHYRNDHQRRFAHLQLENGERVTVSSDTYSVKIRKVIFWGMVPCGLVWTAADAKQIGLLFWDSLYFKDPLDLVLERIKNCRSTHEIRLVLSPERPKA